MRTFHTRPLEIHAAADTAAGEIVAELPDGSELRLTPQQFEALFLVGAGERPHMPCEIKTLGQLWDEYSIACIKAAVGIPGAEQRREQIGTALKLRRVDPDTGADIASLAMRLSQLNSELWLAVERAIAGQLDGKGAQQLQQLNDQRSVLIRQIDVLAGDEPPLEKRYATNAQA